MNAQRVLDVVVVIACFVVGVALYLDETWTLGALALLVGANRLRIMELESK